MKDIIFDNFQNNVSESLLRHKSILDVMAKYTESSAKVNRAVAKSVTNCGCIEINAKKQDLHEENEILNEFTYSLESHLNGCLCDNCRDVIEHEIGNNIFYLISLCNSVDINLYDVLIKEQNKMDTLGKFTFR